MIEPCYNPEWTISFSPFYIVPYMMLVICFYMAFVWFFRRSE